MKTKDAQRLAAVLSKKIRKEMNLIAKFTLSLSLVFAIVGSLPFCPKYSTVSSEYLGWIFVCWLLTLTCSFIGSLAAKSQNLVTLVSMTSLFFSGIAYLYFLEIFKLNPEPLPFGSALFLIGTLLFFGASCVTLLRNKIGSSDWAIKHSSFFLS